MNTRDWRHLAACRLEDPELFHPVGEGPAAAVQAKKAKAVCRRCPVMETCLQWALETSQGHGVWGGLTTPERTNHHRRQIRAANGAKQQRAPIPAFDSFHDAFITMTTAADGYIAWTGHNEVRVNGERFSRNQAAWRAIHNRAPVGRVFPGCTHSRCVLHLTDQAIRDERAAHKQKALTKPPECGTRGGYRAHLARGEQTCQPCRDANADGDRRLRNTGTSKELAAA